MKTINLYGRGDIKQVSFTRELQVDFEKVYGIPLVEMINTLSDTRSFDTTIEYLKYERDILHPEQYRKLKNTPDMYPRRWNTTKLK